MFSRREILQAGGLWLAGLAFGRPGFAARPEDTVEIIMRSDPAGSRIAFDPPGVLIRPGWRIRWVNDGNNVHTATAYHPSNNHHALRIPPNAAVWDSGYLINPGDRFEIRLTIEGIYDYFCAPHEAAGMVGRIIVADHRTLHEHPDIFKPYADAAANPDWRKIPGPALNNFPPVAAILKKA